MSILYYGISYNTSNLGGNHYLNFVIAGGIEIPAYILCMICDKKTSRKRPQIILNVIATVFLFAIIPIPKRKSFK